MKKTLKVSVAVLLSSLILVGCSGKTENESKAESEATVQTDNAYTIGTVRWADWGTDFLEGFVNDSIAKHELDVTWDIYLNSDWAEKKAVMLASDELPDMFMGSLAFSPSEVAQNQDLFLQLDEYIDEYMPNLKKALEEDPKLAAVAYSADGYIYGLPAKLPMRPIIGNQLFINQQWLDNLDLEMPDTYEEFYEVLEAFAEEDANGNGDATDEIPFAAGGVSELVTGYGLPFNLRSGDGAAYGMGLYEEGPTYTPITDNYKEAIKEMNRAWNDGLYDLEMFTQDSTMAEAKRQDKEGSRIGVSLAWTADAAFGINASEYVALPALMGPDGNRYVVSDPDHYNYKKNEVLINKNAPEPEKLLAWLDSFYTEEASLQNFYGSFGIATEKHEDGTYSVLTPPEGESADIFAWTSSLRDFGPKYVSEGFNNKVEIDDTQGDGLKLKLDAELKQYALPAFPNVSYTHEEMERISTLYNDLDSYVNQMASKWITEGGIEEEWDTYLKQLEDMGLSEFLEIQNAAYDRYIEKVQ